MARYTHRVAISNQRRVSLQDGKGSCRWKDYAHGNAHRTMTLEAVEFLRRFLLHHLPRGFQRIRQYGFLANRVRKTQLPRCRELLGQPGPGTALAGPDGDAPRPARCDACPVCETGRMLVVALLEPTHRLIVAHETS